MRELLALHTLFRPLPLEGLGELVDRGQRRVFPAGSQLMRQGEIGDTLFVIVRGRVRVESTHPQLARPLVLAEVGAGEVVGEMGVIDREPRSATVTALEETEVLELHAAVVAETLLRYPSVATALLRIMSHRLRTVDELATSLAREREPPDSSGTSSATG